MAQKHVDSFGARQALKVGSQSYDIFRLDALERAGFKNVSKLPLSLKVLLENLLRQEDNHHVSKGDIEALANWNPTAKQDKEIASIWSSITPCRWIISARRTLFTKIPKSSSNATSSATLSCAGGKEPSTTSG
jgi:aconitate hydratase